VLKVIGFGLAAGAGVQAFRSFPAQSPATVDGVAVAFVVAVVCAYLGGRWHGRGRGGAVAVAHAEAHATAAAQGGNVNLVVVTGEGARPVGVRVPDETTAPWLAGVQDRRQLEADDLDGMDLSELLSEHERSEER
jgi:hypothetical protein